MVERYADRFSRKLIRRMELKSIAVIGPTASGKTGRAVSIAKHFKGEIISADSRQVYRDMSIGTGKDLKDYDGVPYHLIDICEAGSKYNLHQYLAAFRNSYDDLITRGVIPVICGGSGMYVENALNGIRLPEVPENPILRSKLAYATLEELTDILRDYKTLHNSTDVDTAKRAIRAIEIAEYYRQHPEEAKATTREGAERIPALIIGIDIPRTERRARISRRLKDRLEEGMVDEVAGLLNRGIPPEDLIYYGLEYKYLTLYLTGQLEYKDMVKGLETAIHQFAKRQMTWFRGMEKRGHNINWLPYNMTELEFTNEVNRLYHSDQ